ncbi:uncharacterized protein LOC127705246 [Mytilus californianus]|uniref:uncharacterized protein LOC127705246 n=1 Tax=Mytilus californianus TaxID=6549 RepID=UPI0022483484|nr:uncharacterized protein LOC127705246 [Mytilus californianus]
MQFIPLEFAFFGLVFVLYSEGRCTGNYRISFPCYRTQQQRITHYRACGWLWRKRCQRHVTYINKYTKSTCYKLQSCPNECGTEVKELACKISRLHTRGTIKLASGHPSKVQDNAFAINNIEDSCNGGKAKRSSYDCKNGHWAPGDSVCLNPILLRYIYNIGSRGNVKVNEIAGACHSKITSWHYKGRAVDISKRGVSRMRQQNYMDSCRRYGGQSFDEKYHIHCQIVK